MNWYIGQKVLYIGRTSNGYIHNKEMTITNIKKFCHFIGINGDNIKVPDFHHTVCYCYTKTGNPGELLHLDEKLFIPIEEADISELVAILNEDTVSV